MFHVCYSYNYAYIIDLSIALSLLIYVLLAVISIRNYNSVPAVANILLCLLPVVKKEQISEFLMN